MNHGSWPVANSRLRTKWTVNGGQNAGRRRAGRRSGSDFGLLGDFCLLFDHGTIVRQKREMIGKVDREQRSGVRDQKKNNLGRSGRLKLGIGGLTHRFPACDGGCVLAHRAGGLLRVNFAPGPAAVWEQIGGVVWLGRKHEPTRV